MIGNIPGILLLITAFILLVLASCTAPVDKHLAFVRADFDDLTTNGGVSTFLGRLNIGMWGACLERQGGGTSCTGKSLGINLQGDQAYYMFGIRNAIPVANAIHEHVAKGLILHPIAAGVTFFALLFALSTHMVVDILASLTTSLAFLLTLIVFILDMVVFIHARNRINDVSAGSPAKLGNSFWMVMAAMICLFFGQFLVCFGGLKRRRDRDQSWYRPNMSQQRWWQRNRV